MLLPFWNPRELTRVSETLPSASTQLFIPHREPKGAERPTPIRPERRRTPRQNDPIPLFVYGYTPDGRPFYEDTFTIAVNVHGGSMRMETSVQLGQRLLLINQTNECLEPCIVVFVGARIGGGFEVAFSFIAAMIHFWGDPRSGKASGSGNGWRFEESVPLEQEQKAG